MPIGTKRVSFRVPFISVLATMALLCAAFPLTEARASGTVRYATSKSPVTQVGVLNKELSAACRKRVFNQRKDLRLSIGYLGEKGRGISGIALQSYNLYDPQKLSRPIVTYHFKNDGYSTCQVFVSEPRPGGR